MDASSSLEVVPMTEEPMADDSSLKIVIKRKNRQSAQQTTMATEVSTQQTTMATEVPAQQTTIPTEVDIFPTHPRVSLANPRRKAPLLASKTPAVPDSDDSLYDRQEQRERRASMVPPPKPPSHPKWRDRYRRRVECLESLETPIAGVSETIRHRLEEAQKARGGTKTILKTLEEIAYATRFKENRDLFNNDTAQESEAEGSECGGKCSPDLLECFRRIVLLEARARSGSSGESESSDPEDEPVPAAGHERGEGNVLLQCRNDMAR